MRFLARCGEIRRPLGALEGDLGTESGMKEREEQRSAAQRELTRY
jgi:hypothetical protein